MAKPQVARAEMGDLVTVSARFEDVRWSRTSRVETQWCHEFPSAGTAFAPSPSPKVPPGPSPPPNSWALALRAAAKRLQVNTAESAAANNTATTSLLASFSFSAFNYMPMKNNSSTSTFLSRALTSDSYTEVCLVVLNRAGADY